MSYSNNLECDDCKNWKVYIHTFPNGKKYVGITKQDVTKRWHVHGTGYKNQGIIWNAIQKYGWDNVTHEVVIYGVTESEAISAETALIKQLKTFDRRYGYNIIVETSVESFKQSNMSSRKKVICLNDMKIYESISQAAKYFGVRTSIISRNCLKQRNYAFKDEHGIKIMFEYYTPDKKYVYKPEYKKTNYKPVICLNTLEIFDCIAIAAKKYNLSATSIAKVCRNRQNAEYCGQDQNGHGMSWEYYDKNKVYVQKFIPLLTSEVICLNTLQKFNSIYDASKYYGVQPLGILNVCKGKHKHCGVDNCGIGLEWSIVIPGVEYSKIKDPIVIQKKVICLNTLDIFNSANEASDFFKIPVSMINTSCRCCDLKNSIFSYSISKKDGLRYTFSYYNPNKQYTKITQDMLKRNSYNSKKVFCIETNEIYNSLNEASEKLDISVSAIIRSCLNKYKRNKRIKYTFKFIS